MPAGTKTAIKPRPVSRAKPSAVHAINITIDARNADPAAVERLVQATRFRDALATPVQQWTGTLPCGRVKHPQALKEIEKLNAAKHDGHADWRLPEVWELLSRIDYARTNPATADAGVESGFHWANTPYAGDAACFWGVDFGDGLALNYHRDLNGFVRAVRGPVAVRPGQ